MGFGDLSKHMQKKARAAETMEELEELAKESGRELSDEELESLGGGNYALHGDHAPNFTDCRPFVTCRMRS